MTERPPIGLRPELIAIEAYYKQRSLEIVEAIARYSKAEKPIPDKWASELRFLLNELFIVP